MSFVTLLLLGLLPVAAAGELLTDPGFESTGTFSSEEGSSWWCVQCDAVRSTDSQSGSHSVKVTNRNQEWAGITQYFAAKGGHKYNVRAYIKILNLAQGKMYHSVDTLLEIKDSNGGSRYEQLGTTPHIQPGAWHIVGGDVNMPNSGSRYEQLGTTPHIQPGAWHIVGGDVNMPNNVKQVRMYYQIKEHEVNYLLDSVSVEEIPHISSLKAETDRRIDMLRKSDINIRVTDNNVHPSGLTVEVHQTSSEFGWGSAVDAGYIVDSQHKKYQDYFYDNFEWAVTENALKWVSMEPNKGQDNIAQPEKAVDALISKGIKVRGHNIFWAVESWVPNWQKGLSPSELKQEMQKRIQHVVGHFKGKLLHWDVNNENIHGDFYAQHLHDPDITSWMFRQTHKTDPNAFLFLNYSVVAEASGTDALEDQAQYMLKKGDPVHRIGIQSHVGGGTLDLDAMKHRLDELARVGLKMWITELDIDDSNEHTKADKYEQVLRLYFSHPAIEGVMFWGFWDGRHWRPNAAIATGPNVTPNAAGWRVKQLIKGEWRTNESHPVREGQTVRVRGFKGDYSVQVKHNDHVIKTQHFTLGSNGAHLTVSLSGSGNNPQVNSIILG